MAATAGAVAGAGHTSSQVQRLTIASDAVRRKLHVTVVVPDGGGEGRAPRAGRAERAPPGWGPQGGGGGAGGCSSPYPVAAGGPARRPTGRFGRPWTASVTRPRSSLFGRAAPPPTGTTAGRATG